jgi:hypothetical protein
MRVDRPRPTRSLRWLHAVALGCVIALATPAALAAIALRSSSNASIASGTSLAVNVPSGTTLNDVMIASITLRACSNSDGANCTKTITAPSGWTLVDSADQKSGGGTGGYGLRLFVYRRIATLVEPSSYSWTFGGSPSLTGAIGAILTFSGVDTTNPIVDTNVQTNNPSQNQTAPSVDAGGLTGTMLVTTHAALSSGTFTPPSGMTERVDKASLTTPDDLGLSLELNTLAFSGTGTTGTKTAVMSNPPVADAGAGNSLLLRPDSAGASTPGGFNAFETSTASGAITGVIKTKISGTAFSLAVVALNTTRTAVLTTFTGTVTVELLDADNNTGALNATTGCRSTWTNIATVAPNPTFVTSDNGRDTVTFGAVGNAYREVRVRVTYTSGGTTVIGCSSDAFAIRPSSFASVTAADANDKTTGVTRTLNNTATSSGVVHRANRPFTVVGSAVSSTGATLSGYDGTPTMSVSSCVTPSGCTAGSFSSALTATTGTITGTATYSEAGVITATMTDSSFASVDAADSTLAERTISSAAITIGRFVPEAYRLSTSTTPTFAPPTCNTGTTQSFVFVGQAFAFGTAPVVLATPVNFGGTVIANARPRFDATAVSNAVSATGAPVALTGSATASMGTVGTTPTATISFTGTSFTFTRSTTPVASFTPAIAMTVDVNDTTETATSGNTAIQDENTLTISPIVFSPSASPFYYGRIQLSSVVGDYRRDLVVPLEVQFWNGLGWMPLTAAASCIRAGATTFAYSAPTGGLSNSGAFNCATRVASNVDIASGGRAAITLANPAYTSTTQPSAMTMTLNLLGVAAGSSCSALNTSTTATTLSMPWLASPSGANPSARVTWGRTRGDSVYLRERFD